MTDICVSKLTIIGSDNGLSPGRHQAIILTNVGILLIRTLGTNFSEILCEIRAFSFKKKHLKVSSAKWLSFCRGFNVLSYHGGPNVKVNLAKLRSESGLSIAPLPPSWALLPRWLPHLISSQTTPKPCTHLTPLGGVRFIYKSDWNSLPLSTTTP